MRFCMLQWSLLSCTRWAIRYAAEPVPGGQVGLAADVESSKAGM
jgi:hypothetical protein